MNRVFACGAFFAAFALATGSSALAQTAPVAPAQSPAPMVPVAPAQATPNPSETADGLAGPAALKQATDASARLTLAVMINGQGPFDFLIDTGSDRTVISKELAARLKLDAGPDVVMHESVGVDTVQTVLHYYFRTDSFRNCIIDVVNQGGDADTTGAIAGMLAGATYGLAAIPSGWLRKLDPVVKAEIETQVAGLLAVAAAHAPGAKTP